MSKTTRLTQQDLQIYPSQRMTDTPDGGGRMVGQPLKGEDNEIFPIVSDVDRTMGSFDARLLYPAVLRDDKEPLYGGHFIISEPPKADNVSYLAFKARNYGETRQDIMPRIEAYSVPTIEGRMTMMGKHLAGVRLIQAYQRIEAPLPKVGERYCLQFEDKSNAQTAYRYEYFRIADLSHEVRTFEVPMPNGDVREIQRRVVKMEITNPLANDYEGVKYPQEGYAQTATRILETQVADSAAYYGVKPVKTELKQGDLTVSVKEIYEKLVPTATKALNAAMKANPYVLVATALVGLVSYMALFNKEVSVAEKAQKAFNEEQERQKNLLQDERNEIEKLIEVVKDENAAKGQRLNALNKLKDIYPDIFSKYKTEEELIRNIANALKEVNNAQKNKDLQMDKAYIERLKVQRNGLEAKLKTAANPVDIANYKEQIQGINIQIDKATKQHAWQSTLKRIDDIAELSADEQAKERKLMIEEYNRRHNAKQAKNQNVLKEGEKQDIRKTTLSPLATTGYENFSDADLGLIISKAKQLEEAEKERNKVIDTRNGLLAKQKELAEKISAIQSKGGQTQNDKDELKKLQEEKENIDKKLKGEYNEQSKKATTKAKKETLPEFDTEKAQQDHQRQIQDDLFRQEEARIKIMQEGAEKRLAIIQLEYDKQEEEIRRRSQDQLAAFIETKKAEAAAAGKWKKGQDFDTNTEAINAEKARLAENEKNLLASNAEYQRMQQEQVYKELIDKYQTYFERRKSLIQKHETELKELRKTLSEEQLEEAKKQQKAELDQLDDAFLQKNKDFQKLFEDLRDLSNKEIEEAIKAAKKLLEITNMSEEMRKSINARIKDTERMFSQKKLADVHQYSQAISDLAKSFTELGDSTKNSTLSNLGGAIGNIASQFSNLMGALDRYKSGNISSADKVGAVLGFASNLISSFANSARQRKEAEEQYYNSVINYQNAYNLALIEQKRIQKELEGSFLLKDRTEQLKNEFDTIRDIGKQQSEQLEQIRKRGQVKVGTKNRTDWGGVAGITAGGAVTGAMIVNY